MMKRMSTDKALLKEHDELHKERLIKGIIARVRAQERYPGINLEEDLQRSLQATSLPALEFLGLEKDLREALETTSLRALEFLLEQDKPLTRHEVLRYAERYSRRLGPFERSARAIAAFKDSSKLYRGIFLLGCAVYALSFVMRWHVSTGLFLVFLCTVLPLALVEMLHKLHHPKRAEKIDQTLLRQQPETVQSGQSVAQVGAVSFTAGPSQGALSEAKEAGALSEASSQKLPTKASS